MEDSLSKHIPVFEKEGKYIVYKKKELNTDAIFWKTKSFSVNAGFLEKCDIVEIELAWLNTTVYATKDEIKNYHDVLTFKGEKKYYYPCKRWRVIRGKANWHERI